MELRTLRFPRFVPPGGEWFYRIEPQGINISSAQSLDSVVDEAVRFYRTNNMAVPDNLAGLVQDYMCQHLPSGCCNGPDGRPQYEIQPTFFEVNAELEKVFRGKTVRHCTLVEAENRIKVCIECARHNLRLCTGCDGLKASARAFVNQRQTRFDNRAGVCSVYRLPLAALVHIELPEKRPGRPESCWVKDG